MPPVWSGWTVSIQYLKHLLGQQHLSACCEVGAKPMSGQSQSLQCSLRTGAQWVLPGLHQTALSGTQSTGSVTSSKRAKGICCVWRPMSRERLEQTLVKFSAIPYIQGLAPCLPLPWPHPTLTGSGFFMPLPQDCLYSPWLPASLAQCRLLPTPSFLKQGFSV